MAVDVQTFTDATLRARTEALLELREIVAEQLREDPGSRDDLLQHLEEIRVAVRESERPDIEDIVLDVMDFVTGWCSPHMRV